MTTKIIAFLSIIVFLSGCADKGYEPNYITSDPDEQIQEEVR